MKIAHTFFFNCIIPNSLGNALDNRCSKSLCPESCHSVYVMLFKSHRLSNRMSQHAKWSNSSDNRRSNENKRSERGRTRDNQRVTVPRLPCHFSSYANSIWRRESYVWICIRCWRERVNGLQTLVAPRWHTVRSVRREKPMKIYENDQKNKVN